MGGSRCVNWCVNGCVREYKRVGEGIQVKRKRV